MRRPGTLHPSVVETPARLGRPLGSKEIRRVLSCERCGWTLTGAAPEAPNETHVYSDGVLHFVARTAIAMRSAAKCGSSCSQTRTTFQPAAFSDASTRWSRARLASILCRQNLLLFFGQVACSGHPCQKHPSTYTATRALKNAKSARVRRPGTGG